MDCTFIWETQALTSDICNSSLRKLYRKPRLLIYGEKKYAETSPKRASDAECRRLSKPGRRAALTRWLHLKARGVRHPKQQTDDLKWLVKKPEQHPVFILLMETGISYSWERYLHFFFFSLGFSLKCVQGVTAPEHVVPVVLQSMWSFTQDFSSCRTHCPMGIQPGAFGTPKKPQSSPQVSPTRCEIPELYQIILI